MKTLIGMEVGSKFNPLYKGTIVAALGGGLFLVRSTKGLEEIVDRSYLIVF